MPRALTHPRAKKESDYKALAKERGYKWLGPMVQNTQVKTNWKCNQGHTFGSSYNNLHGGRSCPPCALLSKADKMRNKERDYLELAKSLDYKWVDTVLPANSRTETWWRCAASHKFKMTYGRLKAGRMCPQCNKERTVNKMRHTDDDYHELAKSRGYKWLGPSVTSALQPTNWTCNRGHRVTKSYNWLQQYGCKECALENQSSTGTITKAALKLLATKQGIEWIGKSVSIKAAKTKWRCPAGHEWLATPSAIQLSWGCSECGTGRKKKKRHKLVEQDYSDIAAEKGFKWLGPPVSNSQTKTRWACKLGHEWEARYAAIYSNKGCSECAVAKNARARQFGISEYEKVEIDSGFVWLDRTLPKNSRTKTKWLCRLGHQWEASLSDARRAKGCPECSKEEVNEAQRLKQVDYVDLGLQRGFVWLGPLPKNRHRHTLWECALGHSWQATYANVLRGRGCPVCGRESTSGHQRLKPTQYHELATSLGLRWLGPEVPNTSTKTKWLCVKDHEFESAYSWVKSGNRCGVCADNVKGVRVSVVQRELADMLGGELNERIGKYSVDVSCTLHKTKIAIEYDSWYWHADKQKQDKERCAYLVEQGLHVLQILSNYMLPSKRQISDAVKEMILKNERHGVITMPDWGKGNFVRLEKGRKPKTTNGE